MSKVIQTAENKAIFIYGVHTSDGDSAVRIAISTLFTELEYAYLTPAQAREVAKALLDRADNLEPPALARNESRELVNVMPGFTLNLAKETTQGTAPAAKFSKSCETHSHVECAGCACPCHNPGTPPPRRDPHDTVDYLAEMRRYLDDDHFEGRDPTDTIIAWLTAEAAVEGINPQDAAREWLLELPEYRQELERREWEDNDEWPAWPFDQESERPGERPADPLVDEYPF